MNLNNTDTIIFDLGEVIVDLTPEKVVAGMQQYTSKSGEEIRQLIAESQVLIDYETGQLTDDEFCQEANRLLGTNVEYVDFERIWNNFLGYINPKKLDLMTQLKDQFLVLILSNTNAIHQRAFDKAVGQLKPGKVMGDMVHTAHYSHDLKLRKPDPAIYHAVIEQHSLIPSRTLFFDDRDENIVAANVAGINGVKVTYSNQILDQLA